VSQHTEKKVNILWTCSQLWRAHSGWRHNHHNG